MAQSFDLLTLRQVADALGVSHRTARRMLDAKVLCPAVQLPGATGALLFARADVDRLAQERAA